MSILKKHKGIFQFTQFSMIGIANGILDLAALNFLFWVFPTSNFWWLLVFNSFAYLLAVLNSYIWNSRLTFRQGADFSLKEKTTFAIQAGISFIISNGVFLLFSYWFGFLPLPIWIIRNGAKGISMASSSLTSFFLMKYFVFKLQTP